MQLLEKTRLNTAAQNDPVDRLEFIDACQLPTQWANFTLHAFLEHATGKEHLVLTLGELSNGDSANDSPILARVHSECLTGDALFSQRCDCGAQLEKAMQMIAKQGRGMILYLRQEGRGIGLLNKIHAYHLQDEGADTVGANQALGFAADLRDYSLCKDLLAHFQISQLRLMTNNPAKVEALQSLGIEISERIPLITGLTPHNLRYLGTKAKKLGHVIPEHLLSIQLPNQKDAA
jgi:GTP cyclohydrolase II